MTPLRQHQSDEKKVTKSKDDHVEHRPHQDSRSGCCWGKVCVRTTYIAMMRLHKIKKDTSAAVMKIEDIVEGRLCLYDRRSI